MTYTVAELLGDPELATISLTPGVGEQREITWAHVCELADPWNWLGDGALVMTTGLGIPEGEDQQIDYVERSHAAGIAAVSIGEKMSAPPLSQGMLSRAHELGFPVLETALHKPFVVLAQAVSYANLQSQQQRIAIAAQLYESLTEHLHDHSLGPLLERFGVLLGGTLRLVPNAHPGSVRGLVHVIDEHTSQIPLITPTRYALEFTRTSERRLDPALLQYASAGVTTLLAATTATQRQELARGSTLFARLLDHAIAEETARELIAPHRVEAPFRVLIWPPVDRMEDIEETAEMLLGSGARLLHIGRRMMLTLLIHDDAELMHTIATLTDGERIGASAPFTALSDAPSALREARFALSALSKRGIVRFEDCLEISPFLSNDSEQTSQAAESLLAPLIESDRERQTRLLQTLRVYLEEDRGPARTADRLGIHRQTLYARLARIEQLTHRELASSSAVADFWLALQVLSRNDQGGGGLR